MTRLARTLALSVCVLSLLLGSARSAIAQTNVGINATAGVSYQNNSNIGKNVSKTLEAVLKSANEGIPSLNSLIDDTSLSWQTSLFLGVAGVPKDIPAIQSLNEEQKRFLSERYGHGMIGEVGRGITALYNPPASSQTYLADVFKSAHIIPQAQAQGLGFASLNPILETWKVFRNVAYLFFVVIFLVIGFMIMFRQKIGGQTVVTAQQAIPGIIISLIFVTFSYAIAGFMIDLMYLLMYLMIGLFSAPGGTEIIGQDIFAATWDVLTGKGTGISIFGSVGDAVGQFTGAIFGNLGVAGDVFGWIAGITAALVVAVAILIATFKIFFELLKTYVAIVIAIALSPLTLMMGAIPGQNNFIKWLKGIIGNLMAFPVVLMAFIFYNLFTQNAGEGGGVGQGGFLPPFLPGRGNANAIVTLVGIGILLVIPEIIKEVKKVFGAEGGLAEQLGGAMLKNAQTGEVAFPVGTGLGRGLGGGVEALYHARKQEFTPWETAKAVLGSGVKVKSGRPGDPGRYVGGFARSFGGGWETGQKIRTQIDRAQEGRLFEAEDIEKALTNLAKRREPEKDPEAGVPQGPKPVT